MKSAVWCVIGTNGNKKVFGLAVAQADSAKVGEQVQAYNRHGASQLKVLGALATDATGKPMTRSVTTSINGIPTVVQQDIFTVAQ